MPSWRRIVVILSLLVLLTTVDGAARLVRAAWVAASPPVRPWQAAWSAGAQPPEDQVDLRERNARLNAELVDLRVRLKDYRSISGEGGLDPVRVVVAYGRVVSRTRRATHRYVEIEVGALEGVRRDMACLAGWSLAGMVVGEERHRSLVRLITDAQSRIPAALFAKTGEQVGDGLLVGAPERGACRLLYIDDHPDLNVESGMEVLTSGTGGRLPAGLVLGVVTEASRPPGDDHWDITVQPLRRVEHLTGFQIAEFASAVHNDRR
ncbi:MAG: rod shape-determining protein MreC [Planctomycetota bacterium]